jgi:hypothetical protein
MNTNAQKLTVNNITIDIVRKDIKNLHLAVYPPSGRVRIATPKEIDDEALRLFAISKLQWIKKRQTKIQQQKRQSPREYVSGESHYYKGQRYLLNVIYQEKTKPRCVSIKNKKYLDLYVYQGDDRERRKRVLSEWYRKQLKLEIPELIEKWQEIIEITVNGWSIRLMRTRWGTCNIKLRRIWLNLELAKKPVRCLEYIVVHEFVHLLERYHNDTFVAYMDKFLPNWRFLREELNSFSVSHSEWGY